MEVRVRGKIVAFDSKAINEFYNMPNVAVDGYRAFMQGPMDYMDFAYIVPSRSYVEDQGRRGYFKLQGYQFEKYLFLLVTSRIMPSSHMSDVTKDRATLVYLIKQGKSIDIGKIFQASILHDVRGSTTTGMPHSSLITDLCQYVGVTWDDSSEEILKARSLINIYYS